MLIETTVASFLLICLGCFFSVNLYSVLKGQKRRNVKACAKTERPSGSIIGLAAVGTICYFLEVLLYIPLIFTGVVPVLWNTPFFFQFWFISHLQILGFIFNIIGYSLFIWSVVTRGMYAVSWEMPKSQRLVTSGPYCYVRHPSYLGYFFMFTGLFFLWPNLFTLFPLIAIPGYYRITFEEEKLLLQRFGDEYVRYQRKTGRFIPKFR